MDKTMLMQLVATGLKCVFLSPQLCWLQNIRSVEKFWFGCQWKEWQSWFAACLQALWV